MGFLRSVFANITSLCLSFIKKALKALAAYSDKNAAVLFQVTYPD